MLWKWEMANHIILFPLPTYPYPLWGGLSIHCLHTTYCPFIIYTVCQDYSLSIHCLHAIHYTYIVYCFCLCSADNDDCCINYLYKKWVFCGKRLEGEGKGYFVRLFVLSFRDHYIYNVSFLFCIYSLLSLP